MYSSIVYNINTTFLPLFTMHTLPYGVFRTVSEMIPIYIFPIKVLLR